MRLLALLSSTKCVSGEEIARELKISRAAVHKQIEKLRHRGYGIKGEKKLGYSLESKPNLLIPEELAPLLGKGSLFGSNIIYAAETASTQSEAKTLAESGSREGTLVIAERQTGGYGRMKRQWLSPLGGIWFSAVFRPDILPERVPQITLIASLSLARVLEKELSIVTAIKWPNDLIAGGRKIAGILTEMSAEVGRTNWVVAGIGLNTNNCFSGPLQKTAVSLAELLGHEVNRPALLAAVLKGLEEDYRTFCGEGFGSFEKEYNRRSCLRDRRIAVEAPGRTCEGMVERIDSDGYLWLKKDDGTREKIIAGTITQLWKREAGE